MMLSADLEHLMAFTLNTISLTKPLGFCILSSSPSFVGTQYYKELEPIYHINNVFMNPAKRRMTLSSMNISMCSLGYIGN